METFTKFAKKESHENRVQLLPNTDPESMETNNWPNQEWNNTDWDSWNYYYCPLVMGYGENNPETQEKGKAKGWKHLGGWPNTYTPNPKTLRTDPAGEDCAKSDWAL